MNSGLESIPSNESKAPSSTSSTLPPKSVAPQKSTIEKGKLHDLDYLDEILETLTKGLEDSRVGVVECVVSFRSMDALDNLTDTSSRVDLDLA
ncbi:hypothetical protein TrRE_jg12093, partial [Triparma retinervis]